MTRCQMCILARGFEDSARLKFHALLCFSEMKKNRSIISTPVEDLATGDPEQCRECGA